MRHFSKVLRKVLSRHLVVPSPVWVRAVRQGRRFARSARSAIWTGIPVGVESPVPVGDGASAVRCGRGSFRRLPGTGWSVAAVLSGLLAVSALLHPGQARAWGPPGHQTVGAIADALLAGTPAGAKVKSLLGGGTLKRASLWADCVKSSSEKAPWVYTPSARYPDCKPYESKAGQKQMVDFVKRNVDACRPAAGEETCHRQYHYADVDIERDTYDRADVGTSDHDIVSAINAMIVVLQGGTAPAPFNIASKKEALRLLAHYLGDIHQPLHVAAIYLDSTGHEVDADHPPYDPATKTRGGNQLKISASHQLHSEWDTVPDSLKVPGFKSSGVAAAKLVPATSGGVETWATKWATETVVASHTAFAGLSFGAEAGAGTQGQHWPTTEPADYATTRATLQQEQVVKAGARLAAVLKEIWP